MLHYQLPSLEAPHRLADQMTETYIARKNRKGAAINEKRLLYINLLKVLQVNTYQGSHRHTNFQHRNPFAALEVHSLATGDFVGCITKGPMTDASCPEVHNAHLDALKAGILIFLEEDINRKEYRGYSSKRRRGRLYTSGSDLSKIIEEVLGVGPANPLRDENRFIYLSDFYHFVKDHVPDGELHHPIWKTKQHLLEDICSDLLQVRQRDEERLRALAHGSPQLNVLVKYIAQLPDDYKDQCKARLFPNKNREELISFIEFMNGMLTEAMFRLIDAATKLREDDPLFKEKMGSINAQMESIKKAILGILVMSIMRISAEYKYFFSPQGGYLTNGSDLYKDLMKCFGVDNINEIPYNDRLEMLTSLSQHLSAITKIEGIDKAKQQKVDYFLDKTYLYIGQLEKEQKQPSLVARGISKTISVFAQYGIGCAVASQAMPLLGGVLATTLTGPIGMVVYGVAGTVIMTRFSGVVPGPVSWAYDWVLDKIGKAIGDTTVKVANYTFQMGKNGLKALLGHPSLKEEDREFMLDYIDALLRAPSTVVSDEVKSHLRLASGIEEDLEASFELMKP
jgi:hypothetical protein